MGESKTVDPRTSPYAFVARNIFGDFEQIDVDDDMEGKVIGIIPNRRVHQSQVEAYEKACGLKIGILTDDAGHAYLRFREVVKV